MNIPAFKNTNEAIIWGISYYQDLSVKDDLKKLINLLDRCYNISYNSDDMNEIGRIAFRRQLVHEALETLTGEIQSMWLKCLPKEIQYDISRRGL